MNSLNLQFILPETILTATALIVLMGGVFGRLKNFAGIISLIGVIVSAFFLPCHTAIGASFFSGMLINDSLSMIFRPLLLLISAMIIMLSMGYRDLTDEDKSEYYFFVLVATVSMSFAVASNNLMMIYITLETISILSYIMAGFLKRDVFSSESGVKYFLFGALSTGITLYGISLAYGLFGTLDLNAISAQLLMGGVNTIALSIILILVLAGFAFKCSLVPFHMWTPDVYQGAPTPVAAFFSVAPKAVGFVFLIRIFIQTFQPGFMYWPALAGVIAIATMTIGNLVALKQENIKRLLAYSTIAQAGYILVGLAIATPEGVQSSIFYLFIYSIMNIGAFAAVIVIGNSIKSDRINDYAGMYKKDPLSAIALTVSLLSLAGIPPLAGFIAKFFLLASTVKAEFLILAIAVVLNSVIALYYYAKIIKVMFLAEAPQSTTAPQSWAIQLVLIVTLIANLTIGLWPQPLFNWLNQLLPLV